MRLSQIKRQSPEALLGGLKNTSETTSKEAGVKLINMAKEAELGIRDFLSLACDPKLSDTKEQYFDGAKFVGGYEAALAYLNLPVKNDFENGIVLQAASETFQTFPGTKAMFPQVIDDMVKWKYRQSNLENISALVGNSRPINGTEMLTTVVDDKAGDYQVAQSIGEMARIPTRSIRTTEYAVGIWKHGMGYRTSYEFARRASLDILTPYALRAQRELDISKVRSATYMLVNGDSVQAAAAVIDQSDMDSAASNGKISWKGLLQWLVNRAQAGTPVDTVVGNWDAYIQWLLLFAAPTAAAGLTDQEQISRAGFQLGGVPLLQGAVNFAVSSTAPANQLVGYSKADTLEELVESGSLISESEQSMSNQTITYYKTENTGYRLVFGDTRSIYNFGG